jgi:hypothetical protein
MDDSCKDCAYYDLETGWCELLEAKMRKWESCPEFDLDDTEQDDPEE